MRTSVVVVLAFFAMMVAGEKAFSMDNVEASYVNDDGSESELLVINRPVNTQGLTGLLFMNSAFTQPAGHVAVGTFFLYEKSNSSTPASLGNFNVWQGGASVTAGVTDKIEVGVRAKMVGIDDKYTSNRQVGAGDTDVLIKWRILSQEESHPAMALGLSWSFPTGDRAKGGLNEVNYESVKLMLIGTKEKKFLDNSFIGVYLEAQEVLNDQSKGVSSSRYDQYATVSAGVLFPISDDNRVQAMLEYSRVFKRDIATFGYDQNYSGLTPGLRYVTEHLNVSAGIQFINKIDSAYPNDQMFVGTIGYRFP